MAICVPVAPRVSGASGTTIILAAGGALGVAAGIAPGVSAGASGAICGFRTSPLPGVGTRSNDTGLKGAGLSRAGRRGTGLGESGLGRTWICAETPSGFTATGKPVSLFGRGAVCEVAETPSGTPGGMVSLMPGAISADCSRVAASGGRSYFCSGFSSTMSWNVSAKCGPRETACGKSADCAACLEKPLPATTRLPAAGGAKSADKEGCEVGIVTRQTIADWRPTGARCGFNG